MQDERGLYYHAQAGDPRVRVYVRYGDDGEVQFRLWMEDHPDVWERHPWLSMNVIQDAASLYQAERNPNSDPIKLYDLAVARTLLREGKD